MPFSPGAVANRFLEIAEEHGKQLTPMKLQKLVYFAHGWHLALTDLPLVNESVEAWKFGPVIPSLWGSLKEYGNREIDAKITVPDVTKSERGFTVRWEEPSLENSDNSGDEKAFAAALLRKMWERYGKFTAVQLSNMTHEPGTPWYQVWMPMAADPIRRKDIPNELIKEYFRGKLSK